MSLQSERIQYLRDAIQKMEDDLVVMREELERLSFTPEDPGTEPSIEVVPAGWAPREIMVEVHARCGCGYVNTRQVRLLSKIPRGSCRKCHRPYTIPQLGDDAKKVWISWAYEAMEEQNDLFQRALSRKITCDPGMYAENIGAIEDNINLVVASMDPITPAVASEPGVPSPAS